MSDDQKGKAGAGSQLWLQKFVNEQPKALNKAIIDVAPALAGQTIEWVSPLASQHYAEYKDQAFLDKPGIQLTKKPLESFWPERGPCRKRPPSRRAFRSR